MSQDALDNDQPDLLPDSQERLQLALDARAIAGTWFWDVVVDRFTSDRRFARCFSLDERLMAAGVRLADVVQSIHPSDEPRVQELVSRAMQFDMSWDSTPSPRFVDRGFHTALYGHRPVCQADLRMTLKEVLAAVLYPALRGKPKPAGSDGFRQERPHFAHAL